jgi:hypothetical protein
MLVALLPPGYKAVLFRKRIGSQSESSGFDGMVTDGW